MFIHSPKIVTDGLVLCLDAANTKSYTGSGTNWSDLSGGEIHGELYNGATFDSNNLGSIEFDGVNDYVELENFVSIFNGLTFSTECYWFKLSSNTSSALAFALHWDGGNYNPVGNFTSASSLESISIHKRNIRAFYENGHRFYYDDTWHYACYVYGLDFNKLYVDTNELTLRYVIGNSLTTKSLDLASRFILGNRTTDFAFSDGKISQVQIYNKALTSEEILQNYNATKGRYNL